MVIPLNPPSKGERGTNIKFNPEFIEGFRIGRNGRLK